MFGKSKELNKELLELKSEVKYLTRLNQNLTSRLEAKDLEIQKLMDRLFGEDQKPDKPMAEPRPTPARNMREYVALAEQLEAKAMEGIGA